MLKVSEKAHAAYDLYYSASGTVPPVAFDISAELSALAGKSRVSPSSSKSSTPASQPPSDTPPVTHPGPSELPASAECAEEHSLFPEIDWSSFMDFNSLASTFSPAPTSQQESIPQQTNDYIPVSHPSARTDSSDAWEGGVNAVFDQGVDQSYLQDHTLHPALEMQPTWQHFMTQMFGNSLAT